MSIKWLIIGIKKQLLSYLHYNFIISSIYLHCIFICRWLSPYIPFTLPLSKRQSPVPVLKRKGACGPAGRLASLALRGIRQEARRFREFDVRKELFGSQMGYQRAGFDLNNFLPPTKIWFRDYSRHVRRIHRQLLTLWLFCFSQLPIHLGDYHEIQRIRLKIKHKKAG
jgi:hypothetical protein